MLLHIPEEIINHIVSYVSVETIHILRFVSRKFAKLAPKPVRLCKITRYLALGGYSTQWCYDMGCRADKQTSINAVSAGDISAVAILYNNEQLLDADLCLIAVENNNLALYIWLRNRGYFTDFTAITTAISQRNDEIMLWIIEQKYPLPNNILQMLFEHKRYKIASLICDTNFSSKLDLIKYKIECCDDLCEWMIKYIIKHKLPLLNKISKIKHDVSVFILKYAIKYNITDIISKYNSPSLIGSYIKYAVEYNNIDIVLSIKRTNLIPYCAGYGKISMIKELLKQSHSMFEDLPNSVIYNGHLDVLKFAVANGYQLNSNIAKLCASCGAMNILEYLPRKYIDGSLYIYAISSGQLAVVKWLYKLGYLLITYDEIIKCNNRNILKWYSKKTNIRYDGIMFYGNIKLLKWAHKNNYKIGMIYSNNIKEIKFLHYNYTIPNKQLCIDNISHCDAIWVYKNGYTINTSLLESLGKFELLNCINGVKANDLIYNNRCLLRIL
jgi:hypothetical protein